MKVIVSYERECCEYEDMKALPGSGKRDGVALNVKCRFCGKKYVYERYTDAAGDADWRYSETV